MTARLTDWLERFEQRPGESGRLFRRFLEQHPEEFEAAMPDCLLPFSGSPAQLYLLGLLTSQNRVLAFIDRLPASVTNLGPLLDAVSRLDPGFYSNLLLELERSDRAHGPQAARWLQLLESSSSLHSLLPALTRISAESGSPLASKAALLAGRLTRSTEWFHTRLEHPDPRVRANAVEGLWNCGHPAALEILTLATRDAHQRVVANAWVGLYLAGRPEALSGLRHLARHEDPAFRRSAVWALGKVADPRLSDELKTLLRDPSPGINRLAVVALRRTTQSQGERRARPNAEFTLLRSETNGPLWDLEFTSLRVVPPAPLSIRPLDWMIEHGGVYSTLPPVDIHVPAGTAHYLFLLPQTLDLPLAALLTNKRSTDHWGALRYAPNRKSRLVDWQGQVLHAQAAAGADSAEDTAPPAPIFFNRDPRHLHSTWLQGADPAKPAPDFSLALRHALLSLWKCPSPRALIAILPSVPQSSLLALESLATETGVAIHAAGADTLSPDWQAHFDRLGFTAWGPPDALPQLVNRLLAACRWSARVTLPVPASAGNLRLILSSPTDYGELNLRTSPDDCVD